MEKSFSCRCTCYVLHVRIVPVLISGSMFIGLDLTSTDRAKRMKGVFLSGMSLFTDFYGTIVLMLEFGLSFFPFFLFPPLFLFPFVFGFFILFFLLSHPWKYFPVGLAYGLQKK